ncbi:pilus assembly protein TadG-related protein [Caulobacter sp. UNC279MFTsu5.1]|uniref:pilus assembly protein TadG-related protein n=1 Tax=Caulobacter sp. UNC279MFTsu5.1 TaxID=1502775 RepID=UPI0003824529|nr:pilus assembly protein TadG-related protein [Caulobacter sp. UNC279MFTsu5.1]SFI71585.1 Putative Flp pilus-assembly TadE/G-like [Caulobacter sp. UNC279MFTsu5.1]
MRDVAGRAAAKRLVFRLRRDQRGAVAVTYALLIIPLIIAIGAALDFTFAYNAKDRMQGDLDAALLAAVKTLNTGDPAAVRTKVRTWFATQTNRGGYKLDDITIDQSSYVVQAKATASVPTMIMGVFGINSIPIAASSAVAGPGTSYINIYLMLDTSASQMLASNADGQAAMRKDIGCEFACHTGDQHTVNNIAYANNYLYAKAKNINLRSDVLLDAAKTMVSSVDLVDPTHKRIKVGVYNFNTTTTTVLAPTFSTGAVRSALTPTTSVDGTAFDTSLKAMAGLVGSSGDGKTPSTPLKFVMLVTDGVQSQRGWVGASAWTCKKKVGSVCVSYPMSTASYDVTPLNPAWCNYVKNNKVTMAVLYTQYLPIPLDWGYNGTLGSAMPGSWTGTLRSGVSPSITRQSYLPYALEDCASSQDLYMGAESEDAIKNGMNKLFTKYMNSVHLIQ